MDAGSVTATVGAGGQGLFMPGISRFGRLLMSPSSDMARADSASTSASDSGSATLAGCPSVLAIHFSRGGDGAADLALEVVSSDSVISTDSVGAVVIGMISIIAFPARVSLFPGDSTTDSPISVKPGKTNTFCAEYLRSARINLAMG